MKPIQKYQSKQLLTCPGATSGVKCVQILHVALFVNRMQQSIACSRKPSIKHIAVYVHRVLNCPLLFLIEKHGHDKMILKLEVHGFLRQMEHFLTDMGNRVEYENKPKRPQW